MESTSDYWRIWFYLLEAAGLDVQLVNAREVKNVPGPAEDRQAGRCLAGEADRAGHAAALFVPPAEIRQLRDYTRLRVGPDAGTHPALAAAGEAAGGRADQGVVGGHRQLDIVRCGTCSRR